LNKKMLPLSEAKL